MLTCPTCGAQNDPANRFCDQCGSRLDAAAPAAMASDLPTVPAPACPNCGSPALPGEAFCDNCGADLSALAAVPATPMAAAKAPTMLASPPAGSAGDQPACPNCGSPALPGEAFCDNCGADLSTLAASSASAAPTTASEPASAAPATLPAASVAAPDDATMIAAPPVAVPMPEPAAPPVAAPMPEPTAAEPVTSPDDATMLAASPVAAPMPEPAAAEPVTSPDDATMLAAPTAEPVPAPPAADAQAAHAARKTALEAELGRQQQIIAQFEQMQATFGAATPAAVTTGLAEARDTLAQAETSLAALGSGITAPATPAAPAAPAPMAATPAEAAPETAPVSSPSPAAAPAPAGPRFVVVDGGTELRLPADKAEIIVGREDPVSSIFPEVDLTPFGGEMGGVSRQHARLNLSGGQWTITDLNSTNYTRLDGARLEPNTATPLPDGARVQFGRVAMTFHL